MSTASVQPKTLLVVLGSGGHTSEMLTLLATLDRSKFAPRVYCAADSDSLSLDKVRAGIERGQREGSDFVTVTIARSREVKQGWLSSFWTTLIATFYALSIWWQHKPDVILCNGPGTCVPLCIVALLLRCFKRTKIIYVESFTRVKSLSLSGKILYWFSDRFIVQWEDLRKEYPKAEYLGKLL
ncbi:oligosaccharide biosynthesis protein Alg14-like protein [Chytriomyces sp. MP71]|nr:oligosaccharide biosynthesis protein Alg14-like protein [Chytriomyces sp. MP71]